MEMSPWMQSLVVFSLLAIPSVSSVAHCYEAELKLVGKGVEFPVKNASVPLLSKDCPANVTLCFRFSIQGISKGRNVARIAYECDRSQFCERLGIANGCRVLNDSLLYKLYDLSHNAIMELCCCTGPKCNKGETISSQERAADDEKFTMGSGEEEQNLDGIETQTEGDELDLNETDQEGGQTEAASSTGTREKITSTAQQMAEKLSKSAQLFFGAANFFFF